MIKNCHIYSVFLLTSFFTGSLFAGDWQLHGSWMSKDEVNRGIKTGTAMNATGTKEENQWIAVQCVNSVDGLHFITSLGPAHKSPNSSETNIAYSIDGESPIMAVGKKLQPNQYITSPNDSNSIIKKMINGKTIRIGRYQTNTSKIEWFAADLNETRSALKSACEWHMSYAGYNNIKRSSSTISNGDNGMRRRYFSTDKS